MSAKKVKQDIPNQEKPKQEVQKKEEQVMVETASYEEESTSEIVIAQVAPTGDNSMIGIYVVLALGALVPITKRAGNAIKEV